MAYPASVPNYAWHVTYTLGRGGRNQDGTEHMPDGSAERSVERTLGHLRTIDGFEPAPTTPLTLEDLYRRHRMRMVRLAILLVDEPATAEDVVQEAFTGLHRNWSKLRDAQAAVAYLRTAVVNGSRSVLRRRKTARDYVPPHAVNARSAESLAMLSSEHQAVVNALAKLPPRQREVLVLRYYGGLSEAEISEAAGISKGTVKSTASRALESLQRAMTG
ncbi:RNA polymerase sigma24 factor [Amycolatopsis taiwanensis]|uniref:RNA polymerase sigma24 factor n=2 Tax=Amycolatopsis taiwanensis TaxID=342230 RepID=A0A9W6R2M4_9PSEU|nr:RNA polymerase sigma24 factor [Amycolatopsis taiwanensis]